MRLIRKALVGMIFLAPLMVPVKTHANWFDDFVHSFFHDGRREHQFQRFDRDFGNSRRPIGTPSHPQASPGSGGSNGDPAAGNAVPIDGGLVLLLTAGLGLGVKMIYEQQKRKRVMAAVRG
jgi:hypothetical protein